MSIKPLSLILGFLAAGVAVAAEQSGTHPPQTTTTTQATPATTPPPPPPPQSLADYCREHTC
ncbi:hypothetical protein [Methylomagnum ishizawai]|uniref:hypothetical protein n=1 Tax=Methylomagnum ishizawai TaxID=1760988 RepID=UPI001C323630|nr:hypothetical protein [Methylomagnum ishizawai]BBL75273.1 hypothetical protein MishRS11D_23710 [Methylomagnum ishizawai]